MKNALPIILGQGENLGYRRSVSILGDESGYTEWNWHDMEINPINNSSVSNVVVDGDGCRGAQEWGYEQLIIEENRLNVTLDASNPDVSNNTASGSDDGNKRAEIYTCGFNGLFAVQNPIGTIEWIGFNIEFKSSYVVDPDHPFGFFQSKPPDENGNDSPPVILQISTGVEGTSTVGELIISITADGVNRYKNTGIFPTAGNSYDIVMYILHEQGTSGALKLWVNGNVVYDEDDIPTMYTPSSGAGVSKFGIYKWQWANQSSINDSIASGSDLLELSIGSVRIDRRFIGDATYGDDKYNLVKPQ